MGGQSSRRTSSHCLDQKTQEEVPGILLQLIPVEPPRRRLASIPDAVQNASWDQYFLANRRSKNRATQFKLDVALKDHYDLIDGMGVILPDLPRGIGPDIAAETARVPALSCRIKIHNRTSRTAQARFVIQRQYRSIPPLTSRELLSHLPC